MCSRHLKLPLILVALAVSVAQAATAPPLGAACSFLVLATSKIITGQYGSYTGAFGISPTSINAVTIPPGLQPVEGELYYTSKAQVDGFVYGPGEVTNPARGAMIKAYRYRWTAPAYIAAGATVTMSGALGDVIILQLDTLTTGANSIVTLVGGITPATVFYILGSTLKLGRSSQFQGQALVGSEATVGAYATWSGAVLAQGTGITMSNPYDTCPPPPPSSSSMVGLERHKLNVDGGGAVCSEDGGAQVPRVMHDDTEI
ncbi:hypothetical protein RQP46_002463 [Phenoliferia psychrophenolica]